MYFLYNFVSLLVWSSIAAGLILLLYLYLVRITNFWEVPGVQYTKSHFLFGDLYNVLVNKEQFVLKLKTLYNAIKGPFGGFYLFTKPVLLIRDPDLTTRLLITDIDQFTDRGLLTSNLLWFKGEQWIPITDKLPTKLLKDLQRREYDVLEKATILLAKHVERVIKTNDVFDVHELMVRFATATMTSIVFSSEIDSINTPDDMFCKMGRIIATPTRMSQLRSILTMAIPMFAKWFRIRTIDANIKNYLYKVVTETLELRESGKVVGHDYMQLIAQLRNCGQFNADGKWNIKPGGENKHLTIDEVVMKVYLFYAHEFETISSAISFALFELARNNDILGAVQKEIDKVVSNMDEIGPLYGYKMSPEFCSRMTYVNTVVDETLRKYPAVPIVVRSPLKSYNIPNTEIVLDKNQLIFIPVYAIHHDSNYFAQPNEFKPSRFYANNIMKRESGIYFPIGDSSPDWIRSQFTFLQIKMGIVTICSKFNLELASNCNRDTTLCNTLIKQRKLHLRITFRSGSFCPSM